MAPANTVMTLSLALCGALGANGARMNHIEERLQNAPVDASGLQSIEFDATTAGLKSFTAGRRLHGFWDGFWDSYKKGQDSGEFMHGDWSCKSTHENHWKCWRYSEPMSKGMPDDMSEDMPDARNAEDPMPPMPEEPMPEPMPDSMPKESMPLMREGSMPEPMPEEPMPPMPEPTPKPMPEPMPEEPMPEESAPKLMSEPMPEDQMPEGPMPQLMPEEPAPELMPESMPEEPMPEEPMPEEPMPEEPMPEEPMPEEPMPEEPMPESSTGKAGGGSCGDGMVQDMIAKTNNARTTQGMPAMSCNEPGSQATMKWSDEQCRRGGLAHDLKTNGGAAGFGAMAENVLQNNGMATTVDVGLDQWMNSSGHYKNLMGDYSEVGCGWATCGNGGGPDGKVYWTCVYGDPK